MCDDGLGPHPWTVVPGSCPLTPGSFAGALVLCLRVWAGILITDQARAPSGSGARVDFTVFFQNLGLLGTRVPASLFLGHRREA